MLTVLLLPLNVESELETDVIRNASELTLELSEAEASSPPEDRPC